MTFRPVTISGMPKAGSKYGTEGYRYSIALSPDPGGDWMNRFNKGAVAQRRACACTPPKVVENEILIPFLEGDELRRILGAITAQVREINAALSDEYAAREAEEARRAEANARLQADLARRESANMAIFQEWFEEQEKL